MERNSPFAAPPLSLMSEICENLYGEKSKVDGVSEFKGYFAIILSKGKRSITQISNPSNQSEFPTIGDGAIKSINDLAENFLKYGAMLSEASTTGSPFTNYSNISISEDTEGRTGRSPLIVSFYMPTSVISLDRSNRVHISCYAPNQMEFPVVRGFTPEDFVHPKDINSGTNTSLTATVDKDTGDVNARLVFDPPITDPIYAKRAKFER
ncbi:hypothetical protein F5Y04DRAFT_275279 [Hypomontagnella monticulosa]|nr:hypothetical protein F5Y04DRAFT_275279 [Hypomontagnella monticulosa]